MSHKINPASAAEELNAKSRANFSRSLL